MAMKRVDEVLEERGITMGSILDGYDWALEKAKSKDDVLNTIRVLDRFSELKQKYMKVVEDFDETIFVEDDTPLERAPVPKRLNSFADSGEGLIERKI